MKNSDLLSTKKTNNRQILTNKLFPGLLIILLTVLGLQSFSQTDIWTKKTDVPGDPRYGAVGFSIGNLGYIGTGSSGARRKDFWQYNPATDIWTQKADFGGSARFYAVGFTIGSKGYIATGDEGTSGNGNINGGATNDIWEYDPGANTWTKKADFPGTPRFGAVGFSIGSKGYIGTGHLNPALGDSNFRKNDFWEFDPNSGTSGTWTEKNKISGSDTLAINRAYGTGFSIGSKGYIGTGNTFRGKVKDFWEYDPASDIWTSKADFGGSARLVSVGLNIGSLGYIGTGDVGGALPAGYAIDFWEYNPALNLWSQKLSLPDSIESSSAVFSINGKGYIGGGTKRKYPKTVYLSLFYEYTPLATWSGATDIAWATGSNWLSGAAPDPVSNVSIPSAPVRNPTIGTAAECNNLTINSGAILTIGAGKSLKVKGTMANNAGNSGLVIESDASGTGSLIHSTANVDASVKRFIAGNWTSSRSGWHFISSPVANEPISAFTSLGNYDFYGWDEASNLWMNYKDAGFSSWNGGTNFNTGQGYMISFQDDHTGVFSGKINVAKVNKENLSLSSGANYSWHLLGNPFSSALTWGDANWALTNVAPTAKIWNGAGESYIDVDANGTIPSAQGFMIAVNNAVNSLTIPAVSRIQGDNWYKSSEDPHITLVASEGDGASFQVSKVRINTSSTPGFDFIYDSHFLPGYAPQFYSVCDNEKLSTNCIPEITGKIAIPFGFIKNSSDSFNIELKENLPGQSVFLQDLRDDSIQNLSEIPLYKFTSNAGDDPARFMLYLQDLTLTNLETFDIHQNNNDITLSTLQSVNSEIRVTNMLGQVVLRTKVNGNLLTKLDSGNLPNGIYILSMVLNNKVVSKKIALSR